MQTNANICIYMAFPTLMVQPKIKRCKIPQKILIYNHLPEMVYSRSEVYCVQIQLSCAMISTVSRLLCFKLVEAGRVRQAGTFLWYEGVKSTAAKVCWCSYWLETANVISQSKSMIFWMNMWKNGLKKLFSPFFGFSTKIVLVTRVSYSPLCSWKP